MSVSAPDFGGQPSSPDWPKRPVLAWRSFLPAGRLTLPSLGDITNRAYTSSGRAALLAAFGQMDLTPGSRVLVPSYHCPTMVAPVVQAGLVPVFYPIGPDGLPMLDDIAPIDLERTGAMIVAHLFGLPRSLQAVQDWCRARHILLVEDCAHSYFGWAGDRPVGHWGDYAIGSLTKFFPVGEAGLLASAHHPLRPLGLTAPGWREQIKGVVDVVELAHLHSRLWGIRHLAAPLLRLKSRRHPDPLPGNAATPPTAAVDANHSTAAMVQQCDMGRTHQRPSAVAVTLHGLLPLQRIVRQRQANHRALVNGLSGLNGAKPLFGHAPDESAPYVMPLWVQDADRADRVYAAMRAAQLPVFRWDRQWPGTPAPRTEAVADWRLQVIQILCHQSFGNADIAVIYAKSQHVITHA